MAKRGEKNIQVLSNDKVRKVVGYRFKKGTNLLIDDFDDTNTTILDIKELFHEKISHDSNYFGY
jgi:hypoxanthine phosphoribosyltransferase